MSRSGGWRRTLVESLAVVASILLAFAIDAWWDQMREKGEERESLLVLAADLEASIDQLAAYRNYVDRIVDASLSAYAALSSPVPAAARDSISDLLVVSTLRRTMSLPRAAYTDLVSTGGLRLVRDRDLRNDIVRFYQSVERLEQVAEKNSTTHTDGYLAGVLVGDGLLLKRPVRGGPASADVAIQDRIGADFEHRTDPLWGYSVDSREWDRVRSALLQNGRSIQANLGFANRLHSEALQVQESINSYLSGGAL